MQGTLQDSFKVEPGLQADQRLVDQAWLRIGIGLAVAGQAMVFGLGVNITPAEGAGYWVVHGGLMGSALLVLAFLGGDLLRSAWMALRGRRVSIDLLFLLTLLGALTGSLVSTFSKTGAVYYEVVAILIVVHTAGKMLGARSRVAALRGVEAMRRRYEYCTVLRRTEGGGGGGRRRRGKWRRQCHGKGTTGCGGGGVAGGSRGGGGGRGNLRGWCDC